MPPLTHPTAKPAPPWLRLVFVCAGLAATAHFSHAQAHRDPLSPAEEEQIRESTEIPSERVKTYAQIIAVRAGKLSQLGASPTAKDHARQIHDTLEDYASLADELAGNFDEYEGYETNHRFPVPDLRKALKKLEPQLQQWSAVLKGLPANDSYDFARTTALDAQSSLEDAYKELIAHQTTWFREKHEEEVQKPQPVSNPDRK